MTQSLELPLQVQTQNAIPTSAASGQKCCIRAIPNLTFTSKNRSRAGYLANGQTSHQQLHPMKKQSSMINIAVIYDGSFFWRISNHYRFNHDRQSHLNITALHNYIRHHIAALETDGITSLCQISEAHFFRGRFSLKAVQATRDPLKQLETDRFQDQVLMWAGVIAHYQPMNESAAPPEERGVDINLALETYDLVTHKNFDVVVLFTGASDFAPLVKKLQSRGTRVLIPSFDLPNYAKTSQRLLEEAAYNLPLSDLLDGTVDDEFEDMVDDLFR